MMTPRMTLRLPQESDWPAFREYRMGVRSTMDVEYRTEEMARSHFDGFFAHWSHRGFGRFIMVDNATGQPIGHVGPFEPPGHPERELTWTVWSAAHEGKGYAFEAAAAARAHAFDDLGWSTAVSYIVPENLRSQRLAERLGARLDPTAQGPYYDGHCRVYRHDRGPA